MNEQGKECVLSDMAIRLTEVAIRLSTVRNNDICKTVRLSRLSVEPSDFSDIMYTSASRFTIFIAA